MADVLETLSHGNGAHDCKTSNKSTGTAIDSYSAERSVDCVRQVADMCGCRVAKGGGAGESHAPDDGL